MKIVFDARMYSWTGIGRITQKLLTELPKIDHQNDYLVLLMARDFDKWDPPAPNFQKIGANFEPYSLGEQVGLALLLYRLKPDLVHFPNFNLPLLYRRRFIVTINDLTLVDFKNLTGNVFKRAAYRLRHWAMWLVLWNAVHSASAIISISQYVRQRLIEQFHLPPSRITVALLGITPVVKAEAQPTKPTQPFLLYVGNPYPHKNLRRLLEAFSRLRADRPELRLTIVSNVTVGNTLPFYNQLQSLARKLGVAEAVSFPGYVDDDQLNQLYRDAEVFVFPSLSEGFGLPPLEAMAHGTPVITSDATSLPEVCGDAAIYFDPEDAEDMAQSIDALLNSPDELVRLRKAGPVQAAKYQWSETAEQTLAVYRQFEQR